MSGLNTSQRSASNYQQLYQPSAAGAVVSGSVPVLPQVPPVALCFGCLHSFPLENQLLDKKAVLEAAANRRKKQQQQQQGNDNSGEGGGGGSGVEGSGMLLTTSTIKSKTKTSFNGDDDDHGDDDDGTAGLSMIHEAPFGDSLRKCLHSLRLHASRVEPLNDRSRESVFGMEDELKRLVIIIENELIERKKNADKLGVQLKYYSEWEGQIQKQLRVVLEQQQHQQKLLSQAQAQSARPSGGILGNMTGSSNMTNSARFANNAITAATTSHLLERFIANARSGTPEERPASRSQGYSSLVTNRYGAPVSRIPRRPSGVDNRTATEMASNLPSMATPSRNKTHTPAIGRRAATMDDATLQVFNSVSASIYNILEALSVTTRSAIGALWLHTDESGDELSAPFLVLGRNDGFSRKGVSGEGALPFRVGATSSTVGAVAATGIAVSIRRPSGSGTEETLQQALTSTVRSTLVVPVFRKFHATERVCDGAIQIIAWAHSSPFTPDDEHQAVAAANFISHVVSNFSAAFRTAWASRPPFDPTQLRKLAAYNAALDQAVGEIKDSFATAAAVGHAGGQGTLIHRQDFGHAPVGSTKAIMRQELRAAGTAASSQLVAPKDAVRDLQRYTLTLESSWKSAVLSLGDSEKRVAELQRQLDLVKHHGIVDGGQSSHNNVNKHQQRRISNSQSSPVPPPSAATGRTGRSSVSARRASSAATQPGGGGFTLSTNKLEELEADTKNRMRSAAANKQAVGKSTVFLTEQEQGSPY